jgi:hypothetical protein
MATKAYPELREFAEDVEAIYPSAVCSGIVGDLRHRRNRQGTYHLSRQDCRPGTFSVVRPQDRKGCGPDDAAAGVDITMNRRDMILATARLRAVWANKKDPRRKYLNAFNGWDGSGDATRFDVYAGVAKYATPDHKWHIHIEFRRLYARSKTAIKAILSALRGESVATYLRSIGVTVPPPAGRKPTAPPYPGRVLKRDDDQRKPDPALKKWQDRMIERGWTSIGRADGRFGPKVERVVIRFQRHCGVTVDGEIGRQTWPLPWTDPLGDDE